MGDQIQSSVQNVEKEVTSVTSGLAESTQDAWEGFGESPAPGAEGYRRGLHINAPEPTWSEEQEQRRIRQKVRGRLRKRYHSKVTRD